MCAIVSDDAARLSSSSEIGMVLYDQQARRLQWAARARRQSGSQAAAGCDAARNPCMHAQCQASGPPVPTEHREPEREPEQSGNMTQAVPDADRPLHEE